MLARLAAIWVSLVLPTSLAFAQAAPLPTETPKDVVTGIYERTRVEMKTATPQSAFFIRAVRARYFSKGFDRVITTSEIRAAKAGDELIDFDPITAAQDSELKTVTVTTDLLAADKATVSAHFRNYDTPTIVTYDLVKESGGWKVDDIRGKIDKNAWSVRDMLKVWAK